MKVNFLGSTRDLQTLLSTPTVENKARMAKPPEFNRLLEQLDPNYIKPQEKTTVREAQDKMISEGIVTERGPLGSYSFKSPELMAPTLLPKDLPQTVDELPTESVKSPTILSVTRNRSTDDLALAPMGERVDRVRELVREAGKAHGIDPELSMAVVQVESGFDPQALSKDGHSSKGLFQLLDSTASTIIERDDVQESYSPYEPKQNVDLGVRYLRYLHDLFTKPTTLSNGHAAHPTANSSSLEKLAVAAFNAGEGRVAASQSSAIKAGANPGLYEDVAKYLPESTQDYVNKVLAAKAEFSQIESSL